MLLMLINSKSYMALESISMVTKINFFIVFVLQCYADQFDVPHAVLLCIARNLIAMSEAIKKSGARGMFQRAPNEGFDSHFWNLEYIDVTAV